MDWPCCGCFWTVTHSYEFLEVDRECEEKMEESITADVRPHYNCEMFDLAFSLFQIHLRSGNHDLIPGELLTDGVSTRF